MTAQLSLFAEPLVAAPCAWTPNLVNKPDSIRVTIHELQWQGFAWPPTEEHWKAALAAAEYRWQERSTA